MGILYSFVDNKIIDTYFNNGGVVGLLASNFTIEDYIRFIDSNLRNSKNSALAREAAVCNYCDLIQSTHANGYDAITRSGEDVEIKCEQTFDINKNKSLRKLSGQGYFGKVMVPYDITKRIGTLMYVSGYHEGKLVYIISFKFSQMFANSLLERLKVKAAKSTLGFSFNFWRNESTLRVHKLDKNYKQYFTKDFYNLLTNI